MSGRKRLKGRSQSLTTASVLKGLREVEVDPSTLKNIINNGLCTTIATAERKNCFLQTMFNCLDCKLSNVCECCVLRCHKNHMITPFLGEKKKAYCECGVHFKCLSMTTTSSKVKDESSRPELLNSIHGLINGIWQSPLEELTIGQDLPRLGVKHEIRFDGALTFSHQMFEAQRVISAVGTQEQEDERTAEGDLFDTEYHADFIEHLLRLLFEKLNQRRFGEQWKRIVLGDARVYEFPQLCNRFFAALGNDHIVTKVMKASCSQAIVSPMWLHLKKVLLTKDCVAFNDAKGGWFVTIDITPTNIIVVHRKNEVSVSRNSVNQPKFTFSWQLQMTFDIAMSALESVNFGVISLEGDELIDLETESELQSNLRAWISKSFLELRPEPLGEGRKDISKIYVEASPRSESTYSYEESKEEPKEKPARPERKKFHVPQTPSRERSETTDGSVKKLPKPPRHASSTGLGDMRSAGHHVKPNNTNALPSVTVPPRPMSANRVLPVRADASENRERSSSFSATTDGCIEHFRKPLPSTQAKLKRCALSDTDVSIVGNSSRNNSAEKLFLASELPVKPPSKPIIERPPSVRPLPKPNVSLASSPSAEADKK